MKNIVIVDYGMGNLRSIQKALHRIGINGLITSEIKEIIIADKIILPGVGHFERGIRNLKELGLFDALNEAILGKKIPILGICLGMQLMTESSEEGYCEGFGWINANTTKFSIETYDLKIPHIGWNSLFIKKQTALLNGIEDEDLFYFVHSYFVLCKNNENIISYTFYGNQFVSSFNKENIYGVQFHPEKSHESGLLVLKNFSEI